MSVKGIVIELTKECFKVSSWSSIAILNQNLGIIKFHGMV